MAARNVAQQRLQDLVSCLVDRQEYGLPVTWGVLITVDTETREIHATTTGGSGILLTLRLLRSLATCTLWLGGRTPATVDEVAAHRDASPFDAVLEDLAVPAIDLSISAPTGWNTTGGSLTTTTQLDAIDLLQAPLVLLSTKRPEGWPR